MNSTKTIFPQANYQRAIQLAAGLLFAVTMIVIVGLLFDASLLTAQFVSTTCELTSNDFAAQFSSTSAVPSCWMLR